MTTVEKRKLLEAIDVCVRSDLFTEIEADRIFEICCEAIGRAIRKLDEVELEE